MGYPGTILLPLAAKMATKCTPKVIPEPLQNALKVKFRYFGVLGCLWKPFGIPQVSFSTDFGGLLAHLAASFAILSHFGCLWLRTSLEPAENLPRTAENLPRTAENQPRTRRTNNGPKYFSHWEGLEGTSFALKPSTRRPRIKSGAAVLPPWGGLQLNKQGN